MSNVYDKERALLAEIAPQVERGVPGVEVLALELSGPDAFCVYVDHPAGVDLALCERVTGVLRPYLDQYAVDVSSPGSERPLRKPAHFERAVTVATAGDEVDVPYAAIVRGNLIDER